MLRRSGRGSSCLARCPFGRQAGLGHLDVERVHLLHDPLHRRRCPASTTSGTSLNMYWAGNSNSFGLWRVLQQRPEEVVGRLLLLDARVRKADPEVDDPDVGRHTHARQHRSGDGSHLPAPQPPNRETQPLTICRYSSGGAAAAIGPAPRTRPTRTAARRRRLRPILAPAWPARARRRWRRPFRRSIPASCSAHPRDAPARPSSASNFPLRSTIWSRSTPLTPTSCSMPYASCPAATSRPNTVLLVGHNPGVHQLVLELTGGEQLPGFPPSALAVLDAGRRRTGGTLTPAPAASRPCTCRTIGPTEAAPGRRVSSVTHWSDSSGAAHLSSTPAPLLVVGSVVSVQIGGALAKHVIDDVGPRAATALRLVFAASCSACIWRPRIPRNGARADPAVRGDARRHEPALLRGPRPSAARSRRHRGVPRAARGRGRGFPASSRRRGGRPRRRRDPAARPRRRFGRRCRAHVRGAGRCLLGGLHPGVGGGRQRAHRRARLHWPSRWWIAALVSLPFGVEHGVARRCPFAAAGCEHRDPVERPAVHASSSRRSGGCRRASSVC